MDELAEAIRSSKPLEGIPFMSPPSNFDASSWISQMLVQPFLRAYFQGVTTAEYDPVRFDATFARMVRDVASPAKRDILRVPLTKVDIASPAFELERGITLRALTDIEIEKWMNREWSDQAAPIDHMEAPNARIVIEITNQEAGFAELLDLGVRVLAVLRLALMSDVVARFVSHTVHVPVWRTSEFFTLARPARAVPVTVIDTQAAERFRFLWRQSIDGPNSSRVRLALRRWSSAADRESDEDRLIDYWIGLESLLLGSDAKAEVTFRAALRLAALLARTPDESIAIYKDAQLSYDWRSSLVHAGESREKDLRKKGSLKDVTTRTRTYLARLLAVVLSSETAFDPKEIELGLLRRPVESS
jgi:hypothetical protein